MQRRTALGRLALAAAATGALAGTTGAGALLDAPVAEAAEITDVASSFDEDNPFDLRLRVSYDHTEKRASVKREYEDTGYTEVHTVKDLLLASHKDTLTPRIEVGLFQDLSLTVALPIVVSSSTEMRFDQSAGAGCFYPGDPKAPIDPVTKQPVYNCVNASNSTTLQDGIVPMGGYDATTGQGFAGNSDLVFRGAQRYGLDTLNFALRWAPLSQRRDDTKPTWVFGAEAQLSIGDIMAFSRDRPNANHAVSEGVHRFIFSTALSHRFRWLDPYVGFWYLLPVARTDSSSPWIDYGITQKFKDPQMQAGTTFGFEGIPFERPQQNYKIAILVQGRIEAHFDGRGYSEIWEMLAGSDALKCDPQWNPSCDPTQTTNRYQGQPYSGLSTIENYATVGGDLGLIVQAGKYARFVAQFNYTHDNGHLVTADDVGRALDQGCTTPAAGRVSRPCEYNPAYRPVIDQPGRRYRIDDVNLFNLGLYGQLMF